MDRLKMAKRKGSMLILIESGCSLEWFIFLLKIEISRIRVITIKEIIKMSFLIVMNHFGNRKNH